MRSHPEGAGVRPPAVAGVFYPGEPDRLRQEVSALLAAARRADGAPPKAVIAPHAGYAYSGTVAAAAFAALPAQRAIRRAVVIGPAHYVAFRGIAAPEAESFATPLGRVPVDRAAIAGLRDLPFVVTDDRPHAPEHALEVELPFLQFRFQDFAIVPLVAGDARPEQVAAVVQRLWGGDETLIVISSDLSHFHEYETARRLDAATAAAIEAGEWQRIGPREACGFLPLAGLLTEAAKRGLRARRLALCNSGDTAGARDRVVGYGAWTFTECA